MNSTTMDSRSVMSSRRRTTLLGSILVRREAILGILILLIVVIMPFFNKYFLTFSNLSVLLIGSVHYALMAVGLGLMLVMGMVDLSVGSSMALAGVVAAIAMKKWGLSVPVSIVLAFAASALVGLANGLLVVKLRINFLIATLATLGIIRGVVVILAEGGVAFLPSQFNAIGQTRFLGLLLPVWFMLLVVIVVGVLLRKHRYFRQMYFIGSNIDASRLVGIRVDSVRIAAFILSGSFAGLAGVLNAARFGSAQSTTGIGAEMIVISAAVLGGCSLAGGQGNVFGVFMGVIFISLLSNVLVMLNVSTYWHQPINGVVLIAALTLDIAMRKWQAEQDRRRMLA